MANIGPQLANYFKLHLGSYGASTANPDVLEDPQTDPTYRLVNAGTALNISNNGGVIDVTDYDSGRYQGGLHGQVGRQITFTANFKNTPEHQEIINIYNKGVFANFLIVQANGHRYWGTYMITQLENVGGVNVAETFSVTLQSNGEFGTDFGSPTDIVPSFTAAPAITGTAKVGVELTVSNGTTTGNPTPAYKYQWRANGVAIAGAVGSKYVPTTGMIGKLITCQVTAYNPAGSASRESAPTTAVLA